MLLYTLCLFVFIITIQFFYYFFVYGKFSFAEKQKNVSRTSSISVIVCAKNEAENIALFLPLIAEQDHPNFEIILIDNASSDNTLEIFEEFEKQYSNIRLVKVKNNEAFWGNKKYAMTLGIKTAKNDYLLFLEANSFPSTRNWLSAMSAQFDNQKTIVLGYGAYEKIARSFFNRIVRFDAIFCAMKYFSWAKFGHPYMGSGRNLAYKKDEFFKANGFINHIQIRAGEDDLFINEVATGLNTTISFNPEGFTYCKQQLDFKTWLHQKAISESTTKYYSFFDKMQLTVFYLSQFFFIILAILLLAFQYQWLIVLCLVAFRYLFTWIVVGLSAKKLKEKDLIIWFPILELIMIFTQLRIFSSNIFSKTSRWK